MNNMPIILLIVFTISYIINFLYFCYKKSSIEIVNEMGFGYNLGNVFTFNCCNTFENEEIKKWGILLPTKKEINKIKKYGFKTIRFELNYMKIIDNFNKNNSEWMLKIREIVKHIINENMYCILSILHNGQFWKSEGKKGKDKYINIWKLIANEFINYNDHLIFESNNQIYYEFNYYYIDIDIDNNDYSDYPYDENDDYSDNDDNDNFNFDYKNYQISLLNSTRIFIDTIRNTGGLNSERLLIISGINTPHDLTNNLKYEMPIDPANKIAISLHYYFPFKYYDYDEEVIPIEFYDFYGDLYQISPLNEWGTIGDYKKIIQNFDLLKSIFIDKGIPVIIGEIAILTGQSNDINSFKEFLYTFFSFAVQYDGIMPCLWDISEKIEEGMNYYNRESDIWNDEKLIDNLMKLSKGKYAKLSDFYYLTNLETETELLYENLHINIGSKKPLKVILNIRLIGIFNLHACLGLASSDKNGDFFDIIIFKKNIKKEYDGTTTFIIDLSNKDCHDYIETFTYWGSEYITYNNITIEYEESFISFDYKLYKSEVIKEIN